MPTIERPAFPKTITVWLIALMASSSWFGQEASGQGGVQTADRRGMQGLTLTTKDGVELECRYYPSKLGEMAAPVMLVHGWKQKGSQFSGLAQFLNSAAGGNFAVIVPDLRGHGGSTRQIVAARNNANPTERTINADKFRRAEFEAVVRYDLEAVKKFLVEEHNQRRLNIDMLSLVGTEMGALAVMYWSAQDWDWPLIRGSRQGQDVKALVLISPSSSFKGASAQLPLKHPALRSGIAIQLIYGRSGSADSTTARRIGSTVDRNRPEDIPFEDEALTTTLQGISLLGEDELRVNKLIAAFLKRSVLDRQQRFPWKPRGTNPAEE